MVCNRKFRDSILLLAVNLAALFFLCFADLASQDNLSN